MLIVTPLVLSIPAAGSVQVGVSHVFNRMCVVLD